MARKKNNEENKKVEMKDIQPGMFVRIHQQIKELNTKGEEKKRIQVFEGLVIRRRGKNTPGATITVRKLSEGIGVEKIFPLTLPSIKKAELVKQYKTSRAHLGFLRHNKKRLKEIETA